MTTAPRKSPDAEPSQVPGEPSELLTALGHGHVLEHDAAGMRIVMSFTAGPEFADAAGRVRAGFVTGWIDSAMAHAAGFAYDGAFTATLEIKVMLLRPIPLGRYRAEGWVDRKGGSIAFLEGRLHDSGGRVVATATSTAKMVRPRG